MRKYKLLLSVLLVLSFVIAPYGAITNIALGTAAWDEIENFRTSNGPFPPAGYETAYVTEEDVKIASKTIGGFGLIKTLPDDPNGNFTGIKWLTKSGGASAATKYRTQVIIRQGESR